MIWAKNVLVVLQIAGITMMLMQTGKPRKPHTLGVTIITSVIYIALYYLSGMYGR